MTPSEAYEYLTDEASAVSMRWMGDVCVCAIRDMGNSEAPGSAGHHHAYKGGLLVHTAEVLQHCTYTASGCDGRVDWSVLCTAAILHDVGKIYEYEWDGGTIRHTSYRRLVRHVTGSVAWLDRWLIEHGHTGVPGNGRHEALVHAMLAHHGRPEWGSPVEPQTIEAYILHASDMLSARFGPGAKGPVKGATL